MNSQLARGPLRCIQSGLPSEERRVGERHAGAVAGAPARQPAGRAAGGVEAGDRFAAGIEHFAARQGFQAAERDRELRAVVGAAIQRDERKTEERRVGKQWVSTFRYRWAPTLE